MTRPLIILFLTLMLQLTLGADGLFAQTGEIESQKKRIEQLQADISYLDSQIQSVQKQKSNTMEELVLIQSKISSRKELLSRLDAQIKQHNRDIATTRNEMSRLEHRLDTLERHYRNMVYNAYKHRDTRVWFLYILTSSNLEQGYRRWSYLKNYSKAITSQSEKIRNLKTELQQKVEHVQKLKKDAQAMQSARTMEYNTLTKEESQSKAFAKSLDKKQNQYRTQLSQKRKEADRLAKEVERLIAAEIRKQQEIARKKAENSRKENDASNETSAATAEFEEFAAAEKLGGSFAQNKGKLPFPVSSGVIIERFGEHPHPTLKNVKLPFNNGIDISTKPGSNVKVVYDGVVKQVIAIPGYNQCILVQHGQYFTFYCKLSTVVVKVGDKLRTGALLGALEQLGNTANLHFELWNGTTKQNPELWLKK